MMTRIAARLFVLSLAFFTLVSGQAAVDFSDPVRAATAPATMQARHVVVQAAATKTLSAKRASAYSFAKSQDHKPYCWGGGGSTKTVSCYDCSGLVLTSYRKQGLLKGSMRTDSSIRASSKTKHVSRYTATRGDLYFTSGHVGFVAAKPYKKNGKWYTPVYGASSAKTGIRAYTRSGVPHIERVMG
jgi:cell wall-associated NlpC family hydrolase